MFDDEDDTPWLVEVAEDQVALRPPMSALELLTVGARRWGRSLHSALSLEIDDDGTQRPLSAAELSTIVNNCTDVLEFGLAKSLFDDDALRAFAEATGTLHTLFDYDLELRFADDDPEANDRAEWVDALGKVAADSASMLFARFRPRRDGSFRLRWRPSDRELIAEGVAELRRLLTSDDPAIARLFPAPYGDDDERNAGWNILARTELIENRIAALETVEGLMEASTATAEELSALMRTVNDARLVFGTQLGIDENGPRDDLSDAERRLVMVYELLGHLVHDAVVALRSTL